jgi:hypothetical protein
MKVDYSACKFGVGLEAVEVFVAHADLRNRSLDSLF